MLPHPTVIAAGTTILAVMLALLGFTCTIGFTFGRAHFARCGRCPMPTGVAIVLGGITLLLLSAPVDGEVGLRLYHDVAYDGLATAGSMLGGLMVAIVLMVHRTIGGLVAIGQPAVRDELIEQPVNRGAIDCR